MAIASALRRRMAERGVTPEELASVLDVLPETVRAWMRGTHRPQTRHWGAIECALEAVIFGDRGLGTEGSE